MAKKPESAITPDPESAPKGHSPEISEEDLAGLSRETLRDHVAIKDFIETRDSLLAGGYSLQEACRKAAVSYDRIVNSDLNGWGPDLEIDTSPGHTAGVYEEIHITLPEVSENFKTIIRDARVKELADNEEAFQHGGTDKKRREAIASTIKKYGTLGEPLDEEPSLFTHDTPHSPLAPEGLDGRQVKEQLDFVSPAIEASSKTRNDALADGKSLDEAYDLGADEYKRVMKELSGVEISPEGYREAAAIGAFNKERDIPVRKGMRQGDYARGIALHLATSKYKEVIEEPLEHFIMPDSDVDNKVVPSPTAHSSTISAGSTTGSTDLPNVSKPKPNTDRDSNKPEQKKSDREKRESFRKIVDKVLYGIKLSKELRKDKDLGLKDIGWMAKENLLDRIARTYAPTIEKKELRKKDIEKKVEDEIAEIQRRRQAHDVWKSVNNAPAIEKKRLRKEAMDSKIKARDEAKKQRDKLRKEAMDERVRKRREAKTPKVEDSVV